LILTLGTHYKKATPKAMEKLKHGEKVIEAQKRIAVPRRQLLHYGQVDGR